MTLHADIKAVRSFLSREPGKRVDGWNEKYRRHALAALEAFERIASFVGEEDRAKQLREFDELWPGGEE